MLDLLYGLSTGLLCNPHGPLRPAPWVELPLEFSLGTYCPSRHLSISQGLCFKHPGLCSRCELTPQWPVPLLGVMSLSSRLKVPQQQELCLNGVFSSDYAVQIHSAGWLGAPGKALQARSLQSEAWPPLYLQSRELGLQPGMPHTPSRPPRPGSRLSGCWSPAPGPPCATSDASLTNPELALQQC